MRDDEYKIEVSEEGKSAFKNIIILLAIFNVLVFLYTAFFGQLNFLGMLLLAADDVLIVWFFGWFITMLYGQKVRQANSVDKL